MINELRETHSHALCKTNLILTHLILFSLFEVDLLGGNDNPLKRMVIPFNTMKKLRWSNYTTKGRK